MVYAAIHGLDLAPGRSCAGGVDVAVARVLAVGVCDGGEFEPAADIDGAIIRPGRANRPMHPVRDGGRIDRPHSRRDVKGLNLAPPGLAGAKRADQVDLAVASDDGVVVAFIRTVRDSAAISKPLVLRDVKDEAVAVRVAPLACTSWIPENQTS